uniref:Uncharacterized protein n=1 Tax=Acrobeloides nanus TaxID=290746 RepID=A0A914D9P0_9BILA
MWSEVFKNEELNITKGRGVFTKVSSYLPFICDVSKTTMG